MTLLVAPTFALQEINWFLDQPAQVNRGAYSGSRQVVSNPWHGKWRASVTLKTEQGEANIRTTRGFLTSLKGQVNTFLLPATEGAQVAGGPLTAAASAAQGATTMTLNPVLGSDIIAADGLNGAFTSNVTGWTNFGPGTFSWVSSGVARIVATGGLTTVQLQNIAGLSAGSVYRLSVSTTALSPAGSQWIIQAGDHTLGGDQNDGLKSAFATGTSTLDFTPTFGANESVAVAAVSGVTLDIHSVTLQPNNTPKLTTGMFVTVTLPSGKHQMVMLTADMTTAGVIAFEPALREAITSGASVEVANPSCEVALSSSEFGWTVAPWRLYGIQFDVEEAF